MPVDATTCKQDTPAPSRETRIAETMPLLDACRPRATSVQRTPIDQHLISMRERSISCTRATPSPGYPEYPRVRMPSSTSDRHFRTRTIPRPATCVSPVQPEERNQEYRQVRVLDRAHAIVDPYARTLASLTTLLAGRGAGTCPPARHVSRPQGASEVSYNAACGRVNCGTVRAVRGALLHDESQPSSDMQAQQRCITTLSAAASLQHTRPAVRGGLCWHPTT
ncbi:hypothetical protein CERZMDRAFT_87803 [Cercospora zeae-maydis SCOH1-5]|uniref:Uncharacterized protein n=1 Tax=Cercospora zeae-maydis SCOH1-5 TaxID=717836 RepID=A0A6A6F7L9_9PEZI|nr:hypothetical protein CERZMDRAFT_87803 [Cercospora zeae-maydis SCOH1-5]